MRRRRRRYCKAFSRAALARGARVEHREHPEFTKAQAREIARDHLCAKGDRAYPARRSFGAWIDKARIYGGPAPHFETPRGARVTMYRGPHNRVRFYTAKGRQVGPEQKNVAPAVAYAIFHNWKDIAH